MEILITGAGGFVGRHLIAHLAAQSDAVLHAAIFEPVTSWTMPATPYPVDLRDAAAVRALVERVRPDGVFHLAAVADVGKSFEQPWAILENNLLSQVNLLEALRAFAPEARTLIVSSAEVYGAAGDASRALDEDTPFAPANPYSVSKAAQDMLGLEYFLAYQMPVLRARPFNHIGPGQVPGFVASDFASQIAAIEAGLREPVLYVGNLEAERDFTDVRDVVRAYRLILAKGEPGAVYNVCRGQAHSIQYLLDVLLSYSTAKIEVQPDPARLRPVDVPRRVGDASRLRAQTGWEPEIPFEQSLLDILTDWRRRVWPEAGLPTGSTA